MAVDIPGLEIITRPNWPAAWCRVAENNVHDPEIMGQEVFCKDCFAHFDANEYQAMWAGAVFVESRRELALWWHSGTN